MPIYLDNAATSFPKPETVYRAVDNAMRHIGASPGRGGYRQSLAAARVLFEAREVAARFFSIADAERVVFTHSATEALNMALYGTLEAGDHVITTSMEHNSLVRPLNQLRRKGVTVTFVQADAAGCVDPEDFRRNLTPRTRMIAMAHVSNVSGTIQPIEAVSGIARASGALFLLDAAQSAGSIPIDVVASGIDLLAAPGHKGLYGPQGTGLLYVAPQVRVKPLLSGGTGSHSSLEEPPDVLPDGLEAGTHNLPGIAGLKAGMEFVMQLGVTAIGEHERQLVVKIMDALREIRGIRMYGPKDSALRGGLLSFTIDGKDAAAVAFELDQRFEIAVRAGLHCAPRAHHTLGTFPGGTVRISPGYFTTHEDIAFFCDAIVKCLVG